MRNLLRLVTIRRSVCAAIAVICGVEIILNLPRLRAAKDAARRTQCQNNLRRIGVALNNYHSTYGSYPPAFVCDSDGRRLHSWRVLLLPFLGEECQELYRRYNFSEAWDSPKNKGVLESRPAIFSCPTHGRVPDRNGTSYLAVVGPGCAFQGRALVRKSRIMDQSLLVVETAQCEVRWTEPYDVDVSNGLDAFSRIGSNHVGGFNGLLADGFVRFFYNDSDQASFKAMFTRHGDEEVPIQ